ncbi:hypothetical protein FRC05_002112 [Tulasnella sp. 425]|nr:hypothetical protein FRC05_002112 [Tulasnella sp. 425]
MPWNMIARCSSIPPPNQDTDNSTLPLMSKISCTTPEDSTDAQPIEWSAVGRHAVPPITSFASTACRCNLCVDSLFGGVENRLGKQLVASSDTQCNGTTPPDPLQAAAQWEARWELTHEVFDVCQLPSDTQPHGKALSNSISIGSVSTIFDGLVLPSGVAEGHWDIVDPKDDEVIPGVLASGRFIPTFVAGDLDDDEDSTSVYKATTDNAVEDSMSDTSSSDSELSSSGMLEDGTSSDPTETLLDIPSLRSAEIEWDVEDFEIERKRVAEDVDLKRRRDEEDRVREVERKRRRITLEAEYSLECFAREREEEDRRREEARRKQDEELRARLRARLEAIH